MVFTGMLLVLGVLIISAIPLNLAVKLLGGDSSIFKVLVANAVVGVAGLVLNSFFGILGGVLSFVAMLLIYKIAFDLGWIRAFLAWILQGVIVVAFILVIVIFFGATMLSVLA